MGKLFKKILLSLVFGVFATVLITIGIDATDHYDNMSESIFGRIIFGADTGPCPLDMAFITSDNGGFCVDIYEASVAEKCPVVAPKSLEDSKLNIDNPSCKALSVANAVPWTNISPVQAMAACAKSGKRLIASAEWFQASLGTPDHKAPWSADDCHVDSNWSLQPGATGSGANCVSSYGVYDMIGNVWEWVYEEINNGKLGELELPDAGYVLAVDNNGIPVETSIENADDIYDQDYFWIKKSGIRGMARGGYWSNQTDAGKYAVYLVSPPSYFGSGVGFRCALTPSK